jgi:serine/threonine protein kinase
VHRDIKETNLMLAPAGDRFVVKVADFGLAKNFQESGASGMTGDGALGGTLPYMPREQLLDFRYVKPPADVHALGATLYRLLTGLFPRDFLPGENWVLVAMEKPVVPLRDREHGRSLPPALCQVVERALEPELAKRFQTASEMRRALDALG